MLRSTRATRILLAVTFAIFSSATVSGKTIAGTAKTKMVSIRATKNTGSPDPGKDGACHAKFGVLIGKVATTSYTINTITLMMSATTIFEKRTYNLSALGIAKTYSFGKFFNPPQPPLNVYAVLFSLNLQGNNPVSTFSLVLDSETNCVVSSARDPFTTVTAERFGHSGS
jgi:hypothetical protein